MCRMSLCAISLIIIYYHEIYGHLGLTPDWNNDKSKRNTI